MIVLDASAALSGLLIAESLDCSLVTADARLSRAPGVRCPITLMHR